MIFLDSIYYFDFNRPFTIMKSVIVSFFFYFKQRKGKVILITKKTRYLFYNLRRDKYWFSATIWLQVWNLFFFNFLQYLWDSSLVIVSIHLIIRKLLGSRFFRSDKRKFSATVGFLWWNLNFQNLMAHLSGSPYHTPRDDVSNPKIWCIFLLNHKRIC